MELSNDKMSVVKQTVEYIWIDDTRIGGDGWADTSDADNNLGRERSWSGFDVESFLSEKSSLSK